MRLQSLLQNSCCDVTINVTNVKCNGLITLIINLITSKSNCYDIMIVQCGLETALKMVIHQEFSSCNRTPTICLSAYTQVKKKTARTCHYKTTCSDSSFYASTRCKKTCSEVK